MVFGKACPQEKPRLKSRGFYAYGLRYRVLSLNETHQDYDNGYNEEEVHKTAKRVRGNGAQKPEHEEDNSNGIQHGVRNE